MKREDETKSVSTLVGYSNWASDYDAHDNPMTAMVEYVFANASTEVKGARVLELGCGTGRNAQTLRRMGCASYVGIDNSPEMLEVARSRFADQPKIRFEQRDLNDDWPSKLASFDIAIVSLVLEHFERIGGIIASISRVVRRGGLLWCLEIHPRLTSAGVGAHVSTEHGTLVLPSFQHPIAAFTTAFERGGWQPIASTDWYATDQLSEHCSKLARYRGQPVLLELLAQRT